MKLLMLLPNLVLIAVSGFNISNEYTTQGANNFAVMVLHASVLIMCLVFVSLIVRSMFTIVEVEDTREYETADDHSEFTPQMSRT